MAVYHGKTAKIYFGADIASCTSWSLTTTSDTVETTVMGDTWDSNEVGFDDFTGSSDGLAMTTRTTTTQIGSEAALRFYIDGTNYLTANGLCTEITETASKDDVGKISYSFEGDAATIVAYAP